MMKTYFRKSIKGILFSIMVTFTVLLSFDASAVSKCAVNFAGKNVTPECPDGRKARYDISPKCIEEANQKGGNCINTMPVTNVARIPEDVCFRGAGWSRKRNHNGMDYAAGMGTAVTAAMDGKIIRFSFGVNEPARGTCQSSGGGYGNVIYIQHKGCDGNYTTRYGHLTNKVVPGLKNGAKVKKGQVIGYVGGTGGACGRPHLHFEIRGPGDALINPMCDQIQDICHCKTPVPSSGLSKCKDATFAASSSSPINYATGVTAISMAQSPNSETPRKGAASCSSFEEVRNSFRDWGCLFCKPFHILFTVASVMAYQAFNILAKAVVTVVLIAFAIWLCVVTLKFVSTMEMQEPRMYVKTILNQSFRVLFIVILLNSNLPYILSATIDPIFSTGMQVAQLAGKISDSCDLGEKYALPSNDISFDNATKGEVRGALSQEMGKGILCTIKSIQDQIGDILALGQHTLCLSMSDENKVLKAFPNIGLVLTGLLFYIGGFLIILIYPFLLVDSILKLAIAFSFLPAALGAFAFKATGSYLKKVWDMFLNAIFNFIFLSIIIYIIASIAADTVSEILTDEVSGIDTKILWWSVEALKVLTVCFLGWAVLGEMKNFSDSFAKAVSFDTSIGQAGGIFLNENLIKRPALAIGKPLAHQFHVAGISARQAAHEKIHQASINIWKSSAENESGIHSGSLLRTFRHTRSVKSEVRDENGNTVYDKNGKPLTEDLKDENGNTVYDTTNIFQKMFGQRETRSFETDSNGNVRMNVVKKYRNGSYVEKTTDTYATTTRKYNARKKFVSQTHNANTFMLQHINRKDGTMNRQVINDFMQNSLLKEEEKQFIVIQSIIQSRMKDYRGGRLDTQNASRKITKTTDSLGREVWEVQQINYDHSQTTFSLTFGSDNRVMSEVKTMRANGHGISYATDGIIQRKSFLKESVNESGEKIINSSDLYSFDKYYSAISTRPLYSNGDFDHNIPKEQIMFEQKDIDNFAFQVKHRGNKAYHFNEFN